MPNWCCTSWKLRGKAEEVHNLADIFNSLPGREDVMPNGFGKFWLGNLAVALGYNYDELDKRGENMRGHIDSNDGACACLGLDDPSDEPFEATDAADALSILSFSTQSAWGRPDWLDKHFRKIGLEVAYKATDEFHNFCVMVNPELLHDPVCELHQFNRDWEEFYPGQEKEALDKLNEFTGLGFTLEEFLAHDEKFWEKIRVFNEEHEDDEIELTIWNVLE